ncbi:MAG TPA: TonB family protein [Terriglobales bacterium]|nr:TonB family protein [Terriglobales bacterium]
MYLKFYGLREEPFGATPDPRFLYASPTYQEAQATLEYGIRSGRGFTALIARPGMGKTTLLFHLLERYSTAARTAFIFLTQCDSREFLRYLMTELGADTGETDFVRLQEQFGQLLAREAQAGKKVIAVVDEAQNLDVSVLETVRLLSDFETPRAKLLHIILTGQPELADRLASPALLQLRQRISHLVRLEPLTAAEVNRYIDHRLQVAGYSGPPLFTAPARALLVERSEGIPRNINNLCFNALSLGFAMSRRTIGPDILAEVSADLDFEGVSTQKAEQLRFSSTAAEVASAPALAATMPAAPVATPPAPASSVPPVPLASSPEPDAAAAASSPSVPAQEAAEETAQQEPGGDEEAPSSEDLPIAAAAAARQELPVEGASGNHLRREEPAAAIPAGAVPAGPVPAPDPSPAAAVALAAQAQEVASAGNLALRIMPAEAEAPPRAAARSGSGNGSGGAAAAAVKSNETAPAPANGTGTAPGAEKSKIDVEALAADCALFGMEAPKRWKRPAGKIPLQGARPAVSSRPTAPTTAPARAAASQPVVTPLPSPGNGTPARPVPVNGGTRATVTRMAQPAGPVAVKASNGKLWPARPAAAANGRKKHSQRSLYLAAGASVLLLVILIWLLGSSSPSTPAQAAGSAAAQTTSPQTDSGPGDAAATSGDSSVLDVVEELPRAGEGDSETRPAVVMRGKREGEQLLHRVDPAYPAAARANRIQGPVVLEATIGTHGFLRHIRVVSGDPLLADSVLDAVRGWRYRPRTVRGRAVESETRIVVNFQLAPNNSQQNR